MEQSSENYLDKPPKIPDRKHDFVFRRYDTVYIWVDEMIELCLHGSSQYVTNIRFVDDKIQFYERGLQNWVNYSATEFAPDEKLIIDYIVENILLGEDDVQG